MKQKKLIAVAFQLLFLVSLLTACGGGGGNSNSIGKLSYGPDSCDVDGQNRFVHKVMQDTYYWYQEVPAVINYSDFTSPQEVLDFVKYYPEKDRFSYITTAAQHQSFFDEGTFIGLGVSFLILPDDRLIARFVYPDSPASNAAITRGDEILKINGKTIKEISDGLLWDSIFGADEAGVIVEMDVKFKAGSTQTLSLTKAVVNIKTVLHQEVIDRNGSKVGYFVFNSFIEPSRAELAEVFASFKAAGITELVLDLRYNGGGRVNVARDLTSYLFGNNSGSEIFANFKHNDRYAHWAWNVPFVPQQENSLENLQRVFVLTQPGTCSASELVINSLKPFVEVVQIGEKTCGKPVGMYGHDFCGLRIQPIEFETTNHNDVGEYFNGIPVDCPALDDPTQAFGAADENLLSTALSFIDNGVCPGITPLSRAAIEQQQNAVLPELYSGFRREIGAF